MLKEMSLLTYKGLRQGQHMYSLTNRGYSLAQSISETDKPQKYEMKEEITRHLVGHEVFKTIKKTEIKPLPSSVKTGSENVINGGLDVPNSSVKASYAQKDTKEVNFETKDNAPSTKKAQEKEIR
jgi:hypothetical protein